MAMTLAYRDFGIATATMAKSLGFEGHIAWAEAMMRVLENSCHVAASSAIDLIPSQAVALNETKSFQDRRACTAGWSCCLSGTKRAAQDATPEEVRPSTSRAATIRLRRCAADRVGRASSLRLPAAPPCRCCRPTLPTAAPESLRRLPSRSRTGVLASRQRKRLGALAAVGSHVECPFAVTASTHPGSVVVTAGLTGSVAVACRADRPRWRFRSPP